MLLNIGMRQIESIDDAVSSTFKILVENSKWEINFWSLYSDYFTYARGDDVIQSVGWSWINPDEEFTRCVKVMYGKITDYYFSYENHNKMKDRELYSKQVDPDTFETIATYYMSGDGCHKYNITKSEVIVKNSYQESDLLADSILKDTYLDTYEYRCNILLTSRKSYGDMVYICNRNYPVDHLTTKHI
tara:strand:+ start:1845 stop:2408 length:564 start_codon:yes stop_codon:yes gene_type:complete